MKIYLHGPRKGQTIKIRNVQFVDGVAEYPTLPKSLERYHGVKDFPPEGFEKTKQPKGQEITFGVKELDQEELAKSIKEHADHVQENELSINNEQPFKMNVEEITQYATENGLPTEFPEEVESDDAVDFDDTVGFVDKIQQEEAQKELRDLIESKKQELSRETIKTMEDFDNNFGKYKSYVKNLTGIAPRGKKQAEEILASYAEENDIYYIGAE